ncbi:MAG: acetate--CoA ligase family protein [Chloroflexota bacterium]
MSLDPFFFPKSIAVVGASSTPGKGGYRMVDNLIRGYQGAIYPINPSAKEILGLKAYASVGDVPGDIDLVLVLIPNVHVKSCIADCIVKKVPAVIVESGGFADAGEAGRKLQDEIVAMAKGTGTRLWGPNCVGLVSTDPLVSTQFIIEATGMKKGNVSFVAQSGMMAAGLLVQLVTENMFDVARACTIGNKCDVDESDLLEWLATDPATEVIGLYLESIVDGKRFAKALSQVTRSQSVIALKSGRTEVAAQAALSHTGSIIGDDTIPDAMFRQFGVYRVSSFLQLLDACKAASTLPPPLKGKRMAVLSASGASGVVCSDLMGLAGLELAELQPKTVDKLKEIYPAWMPPKNPCDIWPTIEQHGFIKTATHCMEALLADDDVDGLLFLPIAFDLFKGEDIRPALEAAKRSGKPVVTWPIGDARYSQDWIAALEEKRLPWFRDLQDAVRFMRWLYDKSRSIPSPAAAGEGEGEGSPVPVHLPIGRKNLTEHESKELLAKFGIPITRERICKSGDEAVLAARSIGLPVAMKASSPELLHKTEANAIRLNVASDQAVRQAFRELAQHGEVLVQEMVTGGTEVIAGLKNDPSFGPTVLFGLGGVFVEQLKDVAIRLAPIDRQTAHDMIREIRGFPVLEGARGKPQADLDAIAGVLVSLSTMAVQLADHLSEVDINPLIARPDGCVAVDALVVIRRPRGTAE